MSATVAAALKKVAIYILGDKNKRGKLFVLIGSIAAGFLGLMCLPVAVLSSMGSMEIEQPEITLKCSAIRLCLKALTANSRLR